MSYQVLARKWRPRNFHQMVGQTHVLKALINALDNDRLHHAYLFTGTRGVGKTTIARILAKCLNCEQGVSSTPCCECSACKEIDEGRFVDLIEVDAASRTKVEDTRELLDNVQYAPTRGRYKVYLIDEVHMLSSHSFNALLKTLEEPPPHVKFLLATTDPHKLPITVLSRCLQFSLKNMSPERVVGHLSAVLEQEGVSFETSALWQLGRAAEGSMRDALSLTDQAIVFGGGQVNSTDVAAMLGTIDQSQVYRVAEALLSGNVRQVLHAVSELAEHAPDFAAVLADLLSLLHRIALAQAVPDGVDNQQGDRERVLQMAGMVTPEDIQLFYQIGLTSRRDLAHAPDARSGFEMALLRMLAFRPDGVPCPPRQPLPGSEESTAVTAPPVSVPEQPKQAPPAQAEVSQPVPPLPIQRPAIPDPVPDTPVLPERAPEEIEPVAEQAALEQAYADYAAGSAASSTQMLVAASAPIDSRPAEFVESGPASVGQVLDNAPAPFSPVSESAFAGQPAPVDTTLSETVVTTAGPGVKLVELRVDAASIGLTDLQASDWVTIHTQLGLGGVTGTVASHCELVSVADNRLQMVVDQQNETLFNATHQQRIAAALEGYFGQKIDLEIKPGQVHSETPAMWRDRKQSERLQQARQSIYEDPNVQALQQHLAAEVLEHTIAPID